MASSYTTRAKAVGICTGFPWKASGRSFAFNLDSMSGALFCHAHHSIDPAIRIAGMTSSRPLAIATPSVPAKAFDTVRLPAHPSRPEGIVM